MKPTSRLTRWLLAAVATVAGVALFAGFKSKPVPRRDPVGVLFPSVSGEALDGARWAARELVDSS